jgi:membrane-bound metal-dependent hydrolase YbcI (DUF457 family)
MLAFNHATLATATVMGISLYYNQPFFLPFLIFSVFAGVVPDIDHPGSELGKYFKPIGALLPHRGVTHSFLGVALFAGGLNFLLGHDNQYLTYFLIFGAMFGVNLLEKIVHKNLNRIDSVTAGIISQKQIDFLLKISSIGMYAMLFFMAILSWNTELKLQAIKVISISYFAHIIGDFVTIEGVPLFWPFKNKFGLRLFRTGGGIEAFVGFWLVVGNIYLLYQLNLRDNFIDPSYWQKFLAVR